VIALSGADALWAIRAGGVVVIPEKCGDYPRAKPYLLVCRYLLVADLTVSRPIPLLAPMSRTVATASYSRSTHPLHSHVAMQAAAPQERRAA
jgi:hypothetical protein